MNTYKIDKLMAIALASVSLGSRRDSLRIMSQVLDDRFSMFCEIACLPGLCKLIQSKDIEGKTYYAISGYTSDDSDIKRAAEAVGLTLEEIRGGQFLNT